MIISCILSFSFKYLNFRMFFCFLDYWTSYRKAKRKVTASHWKDAITRVDLISFQCFFRYSNTFITKSYPAVGFPLISIISPSGMWKSTSGDSFTVPANTERCKRSTVANPNPPERLLPESKMTFLTAVKLYSSTASWGITIVHLAAGLFHVHSVQEGTFIFIALYCYERVMSSHWLKQQCITEFSFHVDILFPPLI